MKTLQGGLLALFFLVVFAGAGLFPGSGAVHADEAEVHVGTDGDPVIVGEEGDDETRIVKMEEDDDETAVIKEADDDEDEVTLGIPVARESDVDDPAVLRKELKNV